MLVGIAERSEWNEQIEVALVHGLVESRDQSHNQVIFPYDVIT
jgi:hypothetical protein